jgi:hypothetical protein
MLSMFFRRPQPTRPRRLGVEALEDRLAPSATQAWVARYDGTGTASNEDNGRAVAVDASGNVYVTGVSEGTDAFGTDFDFLTAKYDASGTLLWAARYDGPGNDHDSPRALALDASGNVYVTGPSVGTGGNFDYATLKYDTNGNLLWGARYSGPGGDDAYDIAVDGSGNVFVTGSSSNATPPAPTNAVTVAYDSTGALLWTAAYASPGGGSAYTTDLVLDGAGNVYVTGASQTGGLGTFSDYVTVKYNSVGTQQWAALYNGVLNGSDAASAIGLDSSGNVYVTGTTSGYGGSSPSYLTVKYNSAGTQLWTAGFGTGSQFAWDLAVDGSGNVYVTGTGGTVKYNTSGVQQWSVIGGDIRAIALDSAGNVYVTGFYQPSTTSNDYYTAKYDSSGNTVWSIGYNGPGSSLDESVSIALDSSGNVYVTGQSFGSGTGRDIATIKYT